MQELVNLRKICGETLEKLGGKHKNLIVLDSDLGNQLYSLNFAKSYPERHFTFAETEELILSAAAGFTVRKKITFVCAEASKLLGKAGDILRNAIIYPNLNVKILLTGCGISNIEEGPIKCSFDDLAQLLPLPNLKIFSPADQHDLRAILEFTVTDYAPTIIRIPKLPTGNYLDQNYLFQPGEPLLLQRGDQIALVTCSGLLNEVSAAAKELGQKGISAAVIHLNSLKPLNENNLANLLSQYEMIAIIEDHFQRGGLTHLVGAAMVKSPNQIFTPSKLIPIALQQYPESSRYPDALTRSGLSSKAIYEKIRDAWTQH
ncbi:hypothetical protein IT411_00295 [Candidatus Peregrinibacteria bacterium]|nr:hypothetical protein [Candidatus Peregrinibacteria bacterium]